ncbi:MAG: hypothetical protein M1827_001924 [Pycnora praestabilis]|nr:MAG: hypothetical protein M1827_001924 [Pycnora praestabilis]
MADHRCPTTTTKVNGVPAHLPSIYDGGQHHYLSHHPLENAAAKGTSFYSPEQKILAGTTINPQISGKPIPKLFQPLQLRGLTLQNRIMVSPMCQYSADNGHQTLWHLTHLGGIIQRGPALTIVEATSVTPEGRISPEDCGLWQDSQIAPLRMLTDFAHSQGQHVCIQLGHAGRKASTVAPWIDRKAGAPTNVGGWPENILSASAIPYDEHVFCPKAMTLADIEDFKISWVAAVERALKANFDVIEVHAGHGYLLPQFLSPATNHRTDKYGGSLENRMRLILEIVDLTRKNIPEEMPLLVRISATDWLEYDPSTLSWDIDQAIALSQALVTRGVDLLDVSSGGLVAAQKIKSGPGYQAPFSKAIREAVQGSGVAVGVVGMITSGSQANELLDQGYADVAIVGRAFQKNPGLVWSWAEELEIEVRVANQIGWGFGQRPLGGIKFRGPPKPAHDEEEEGKQS